MNRILKTALAISFLAAKVFAVESIPTPSVWSFPEIVESALEITPVNIDGLPFNQFGIAYEVDVLEKLDLATIKVEDLQKYADAVTHAYPDAVVVKSQLPSNCESMPADQFNETSLASLAYISLNAVEEANRNTAKSCLQGILQNLRKK